MALALTKIAGPYTIGNRWQTVFKVVADSSYPTGGWSLLRSDLGFASTADDRFQVEINNTAGYGCTYDYTNQKLKLYSGTKVLTATFDPASLGAITSRDDAITFTGVVSTDQVIAVIPPNGILSSVVVQNARVTATDQITVRLTNPSAGAVDVASGTWTAILQAASGASKEITNATDLSTIVTDLRVTATGHYAG
jgi:hypothetical protein